MTMDAMEVLGSQPHAAATSPFLLSSPPLGHHHATFNLQTVQLSFDACLTYNASTACSSNNTGCIGSVNFLSGTTPSTSIATVASASIPAAVTASTITPLSSKPIPTLNLTTLPIQQQCNTSNLMEHRQIQNHELRKRLEIENSSPLDECIGNIKKRRLQRTNCDDNNKECSVQCREDVQNSDEKDKPGDLNTPVTTSSDLPSFFGPAVLVEPPPISGI
jgi:hypothetical protein